MSRVRHPGHPGQPERIKISIPQLECAIEIVNLNRKGFECEELASRLLSACGDYKTYMEALRRATKHLDLIEVRPYD